MLQPPKVTCLQDIVFQQWSNSLIEVKLSLKYTFGLNNLRWYYVDFQSQGDRQNMKTEIQIFVALLCSTLGICQLKTRTGTSTRKMFQSGTPKTEMLTTTNTWSSMVASTCTACQTSDLLVSQELIKAEFADFPYIPAVTMIKVLKSFKTWYKKLNVEFTSKFRKVNKVLHFSCTKSCALLRIILIRKAIDSLKEYLQMCDRLLKIICNLKYVFVSEDGTVKFYKL